MRRTHLAIATLLCFGLAACSDDQTAGVQPRLSVKATHKDENGKPLNDFGPVPVLLKNQLPLVIANVGRAQLQIRTFELQDEAGVFEMDQEPGPFSLSGGDEVEVVLTFRPKAQEPYVASILIESNDPRNESVVVTLEGFGSTIGKVEIEPVRIDYGMVGEWTQAVENVRIASVGTAPLLVEAIEIVAGSSPAFAVLGSTRPTELPPPGPDGPGGEVVIQVACAPTDETDDEIEGLLRIRTTDPERREIEIPLTASVNRAPIAIFEIDPANHAPMLPVALDATESYDPDGHEPLTFAWRVTNVPIGSDAYFDDPTSPTPTLTVTQPGTYRIGLDVYDAHGLACRAPEGSLTLPCFAQDLDILSEDDIFVRLRWTHERTDLDLHLLEGNNPLYSEGDCFYDNLSPDFGILGDDTDDPLFLRDSLKGFGPEDIVFSDPSPGTYRVQVVYAKTNGAPEPETEALLQVYVFGKLEAQMSAVLTEPGQVWDVLTIDWPSAEIDEVDEILQAVAP